MAVAAGLFWGQERLLFPGSWTQGRPQAAVRVPAGAELVTLATARGERIAALFGPALAADGRPLADAASRPTVLHFYGNGTWLAAAAGRLEELRRLGVNVMIPEYVGYGLSGGHAGEEGCYATADAAYDYLLSRPGVCPRRIIVSGESLGGAVAIDLASRKPVAGLATFTTFSRMTDVASLHAWAFPVPLMLRHRFESRDKMAHVRCPVFLAHGTKDTTVPCAMCAELASAARAPVIRFTVEGAGHNDFFAAGGRPLLEALRRWIFKQV